MMGEQDRGANGAVGKLCGNVDSGALNLQRELKGLEAGESAAGANMVGSLAQQRFAISVQLRVARRKSPVSFAGPAPASFTKRTQRTQS